MTGSGTTETGTTLREPGARGEAAAGRSATVPVSSDPARLPALTMPSFPFLILVVCRRINCVCGCRVLCASAHHPFFIPTALVTGI